MTPLDTSLQQNNTAEETKPHQSSLPSEEWRLTLEDRVICLRQTERELFYKAHFPAEPTDKPASEAQDSTLLWLKDYFQLNVDLEALYTDWSNRDPMFKKVAPRFVGIRILRQDPWENLLHLQPKQSYIPHNVHAWHPFPPPKALADSSVEAKLRELGFGYRAKYIQKTAALLCEKYQDPMKELLDLRLLPTAKARERLLEFHGVGPKVADCILLMSLDKAEVVPVDTHVQQIATKMYGFKSRVGQAKTMNPKLYSEIATKFADTWGPYAGWAHSVLFTADLKSFANFGLEPSATAASSSGSMLPLPSPAPLPDNDPLDEKPVESTVESEVTTRPKALRKRKSESATQSVAGEEINKEIPEGSEASLAERVKRRRRPKSLK